MTAAAASPGSSPALVLPSELTIYNVGELHPQWLIWLSEVTAPGVEGVVEVQGGAVDLVDAAGLQLLLSLHRTLSIHGRHHRITGASSALAAGCAGLGLADWLQTHSEEAIA